MLHSIASRLYVSFTALQNDVLKSLRAKASIVKETFDSIDGVSCNAIQGSMYCFPQLDLPQKLVDHAKVYKYSSDQP